MNKTLLLSILFFFNLSFSQTISLDTNFGDNGIKDILLTEGEADYLKIINFNNTNILAFSKTYNSSAGENYIYKLNLDGSFDTSFGTNGILTLPDYKGDFEVFAQGSDKFIVDFETVNPYGTSNNEKAFLRYNSNGVLDATFGTNGEFRINHISNSSRGNNLHLLSDNTLLFKDSERMIKYTANGLIDTSYGSNGVVLQNSSEVMIDAKDGNFLLQYSTKLDKIGGNGNSITTFGNNGTCTYPVQGDYYSKVTDSGNIYTIEEGDLPVKFYYFNSNGNLMTSFNTTGILDVSADNGNLLYANDILFDSNKFFIVGETNDTKPFISCYDNSGNIVTLNSQNSYKEDAISNGYYTSLVVLNGSLYAGGDYFDTSSGKWHYIVSKYSSPTLGVTDNNYELNKFVVENPVSNNLNINSEFPIKKISVYTMDGKLVSDKLSNNSDVSFLSSGIYLLKADFSNANQSKYLKIIKE